MDDLKFERQIAIAIAPANLLEGILQYAYKKAD